MSDATLAESDSSSSLDSVLLEGLHLRPTNVCERRNTGCHNICSNSFGSSLCWTDAYSARWLQSVFFHSALGG